MEILVGVMLGVFLAASGSLLLVLRNIEKQLSKISDGMVEIAGRNGHLPDTLAVLNRIATALEKRSSGQK